MHSLTDLPEAPEPSGGRGGHRGHRLAGSVVALPFHVVGAAIRVAYRSGRVAGTVSVRATAVAGRRLGVVGVAALAVGVIIGLLFAPVPGRQLRQRLATLIAGARPVPDDHVRQAVVASLGASPRTWQLPEPDVAVAGGVVTLTGEVPSETARVEMEVVAAGTPGVQGVVNHLVTS
jgi:hypothetical protein